MRQGNSFSRFGMKGKLPRKESFPFFHLSKEKWDSIGLLKEKSQLVSSAYDKKKRKITAAGRPHDEDDYTLRLILSPTSSIEN